MRFHPDQALAPLGRTSAPALVERLRQAWPHLTVDLVDERLG